MFLRIQHVLKQKQWRANSSAEPFGNIDAAVCVPHIIQFKNCWRFCLADQKQVMIILNR